MVEDNKSKDEVKQSNSKNDKTDESNDDTEKIIDKEKIQKKVEENTEEETKVPEENDSKSVKKEAGFKNSATGVPGLDEALNGGFPKNSVILLSGDSGTGKTIMSFQWLFEGTRRGENVVYITMTEPIFKTLRNLETMSFYNQEAIENEKINILDIRDTVYSDEGVDTSKIIDVIEKEVKEKNAKRLCVDSITAIAYLLENKARIRRFIFELGQVLASLGCTTLLTSEVAGEGYSVYGVEEFISDAIVKLERSRVSNMSARSLGVIKVRGKGYDSHDLNFKINNDGIRVLPRFDTPLSFEVSDERVSTGVPQLDEMIAGGLFKGSNTLISGPTGTGKTLSCMHLINAGLENGKNCLYLGSEESESQLIRTAKGFGWDFQKYIDNGKLVIRSKHPREMLPNEHYEEIMGIVNENDIDRCVIDSISAYSNTFEEKYIREFLGGVSAFLKSEGITAYYTLSSDTLFGTSQISGLNISSLIDNIIMLRYIEVEGELNRMINIIKLRGSYHSKGLRSYEITDKGMKIGLQLSGYEGVMTGVTRKVAATVEEDLKEIFQRYIGPMGRSVFEDIKKRGITTNNVINIVNNLVDDNIIKQEDADKFKEEVLSVLKEKRKGKIGDEEVKKFFKEEEKDKKEKKGYIKRMFNT